MAAANVVGKVVFHSKALGDIANFVKANWPVLLFALIVIICLISFLKWNAKKANAEEAESKDQPKKDKKANKRSEGTSNGAPPLSGDAEK